MAAVPLPSESGSLIELREGLGLGGGRGVFALGPLSPGQLLLVEKPLVLVPADKAPDERLHVSLARALLTSPEWRARLDAVSHLHPERSSDLPGGVEGAAVAAAWAAYGEDVDRIVALHAQAEAARSSGADSGGLLATPDDVLRLILAVQCNAFYSGFHVHCSMFNHCCSPSCIKLALPNGASEVRALREITHGEECTISYLSPPLQSFSRRSAALSTQHYFELLPPSAFPPHGEELAGGGGGSDEAGLAETEDFLDADDARGAPASVAEARQRVADAQATCARAAALLHPHHVAALRAHGTTARACRDLLLLLSSDDGAAGEEDAAGAAGAAAAAAEAVYVQQTPHEAGAEAAGGAGGEGGGGEAGGRGPATAEDAALALLAAVCAQRECQDALLTPDHYDVDLAFQDLHQTLGYLLANAPKALFAAFPQWGSFSKASLAESKAKKRHLQVSRAYQTGFLHRS
ncbi:hypothetical protein FOA52_010601 [Chlamydomonas sp. UWO 241]|nr:hypothetical protein FOA52_010601 [Chlamydomonas sp. UWO 241]